MLKSCLGSIRWFRRRRNHVSTSIYSKYVVKHKDINHEFHKYIKWVPPEELKHWHPQKTCDLRPLPAVDPKRLRVEFQPFADVIDKLPEEKRKLFTVEYGRRKDKIKVIMEDTVSLFKQHMYDKESLPYKIAATTVKIRSYQDMFARSEIAVRSGGARYYCKVTIDARKRYLTTLREEDYRCFEWIIELLGLIYKPKTPYVPIERRASLDSLVAMYCNQIRDRKMKEYKDLLDKEKIPFLESKLETLQRIKEDEDSINVPCSVEEDIEATVKKLEELKKTQMVLHPVNRDDVGSERNQIPNQ